MFNGLRSDSMALSHVWLGLTGGDFQSDGGLQIAAVTVCDVAKESQASFRYHVRKRGPRHSLTGLANLKPELTLSQILPTLQTHSPRTDSNDSNRYLLF